MTEISHASARSLIQADADGLLYADQKSALDLHLAHCLSCRSYAGDIAGLETRLRAAFESRWGSAPLPHLDRRALPGPNPAWTVRLIGILGNRQLAGPALVTALVTLALFATLRPIQSGGSTTTTQPPTVTVPHSPVTAFEQTATRLVLPGCFEFIHVVQQGETVSSISAMYSMAGGQLMAYNGLETEQVAAGTELLIPGCTSTPLTGSITPSHTLTFTPQSKYGSNTP